MLRDSSFSSPHHSLINEHLCVFWCIKQCWITEADISSTIPCVIEQLCSRCKYYSCGMFDLQPADPQTITKHSNFNRCLHAFYLHVHMYSMTRLQWFLTKRAPLRWDRIRSLQHAIITYLGICQLTGGGGSQLRYLHLIEFLSLLDTLFIHAMYAIN